MGWIKNFFRTQPATPIFDEYSPQFTTPPVLPFVCRVVSQSRPSVTYTVNVDLGDNWTCTCPDFAREHNVLGRSRYFCKHCITIGYITGLKRPKRWRRSSGGKEWLIGEILTLGNGSSRMTVDGYVTKSELRDVYDMTPRLIEKFFRIPDEEAVFPSMDGEYRGECELYDENRVKSVVNSAEFLEEKEKTERARESARKGNAKRAETLARKRAMAEKARAEAREAFGGCIYVVRCTYSYGWHEYGVYARDLEHARQLVEQWFRTDEGQYESSQLYEDAVDDYQCEMDEYRELMRDSSLGEELQKPERPKKRDFKLVIEDVSKSELDVADFEIEEILLTDHGGRWSHDLFGNR